MVLFICTAIADAQPPAADHHIHIRSDDATEALVCILLEVEGMENVPIESAAGASDVIARLDSSGTRYAALLSTAYFFTMPDLDFKEAESRTRKENDFVASQAEQAPGRLAAFCSVNPLSSFALSEITRCGESGRFAGLKLHFANSGIDLRKSEDVNRLKKVFSEAAHQKLAVIVHTWTRNPDYGAKDIRIFIDEVLPEADEIPVQVAHLGGPGTFSEVTSEAARVFAEEIERNNPVMENVYFDISEVPHHPDRAEDRERREAMEQANRELANIIDQLGPGRVFWGTDWIAGPVEVYLMEMQPMSLPESTWDKIRENIAPYFQ